MMNDEKREECYKCKGVGLLYPVYHDGDPINCWVCTDKDSVKKLVKKQMNESTQSRYC